MITVPVSAGAVAGRCVGVGVGIGKTLQALSYYSLLKLGEEYFGLLCGFEIKCPGISVEFTLD
jgi:hypothetical protein